MQNNYIIRDLNKFACFHVFFLYIRQLNLLLHTLLRIHCIVKTYLYMYFNFHLLEELNLVILLRVIIERITKST